MSSSEESTWISWFCSLRGNEFFTEVDSDYITDKFNLTGLEPFIPKYNEALELVLDLDVEEPEEDERTVVEAAAESLYGLVHARYILTNKGINQMAEKWYNGDFGYCPRVYCENNKMLPIGLSDTEGEAMVKLFCPQCNDIYEPKASRHHHVDGAYFGTSFPHMVFMAHPKTRPQPPKKKFVPSLYGFVISKNAYDIQYKTSESRRTRQKQRDALLEISNQVVHGF